MIGFGRQKKVKEKHKKREYEHATKHKRTEQTHGQTRRVFLIQYQTRTT